jgi:hypothetical protein
MAASVQQRIAGGERAGQQVRRIGSGFGAEGEAPRLTGPRCASVHGFSLHANTAIPAHLHHPCRPQGLGSRGFLTRRAAAGRACQPGHDAALHRRRLGRQAQAGRADLSESLWERDRGREGALPPLPEACQEPATAYAASADSAPARPRRAGGHSPPPAHHRPGPATEWHLGSGQWAR